MPPLVHNVIIPANEVIRFYYAYSSDLSKAIFNGVFRHNLPLLIDTELCGINLDSRMAYVMLQMQTKDQDAWVIARILFSKYARRAAYMVHDSIIRQASKEEVFLHPKADLPFRGETTLSVKSKGIIVNKQANVWRTLILSIEQCSGEMPFNELMVDRKNNASQANPKTDIENEDKMPINFGSKESKAYEGEAIQSGSEPSNFISAVTLSLIQDRFTSLAGKELIKPEKEMCQYIHSKGVTNIRNLNPSNETGTGDGLFSDTQISKAHIQTQRQKALPASFDLIERVINYINDLPNHTAKIRIANEKIQHMPLVTNPNRHQWSYLDSKNKIRRRTLIADIKTPEGLCCTIIEFEKREKESAFSLGLIQSHHNISLSDQTIHSILYSLARKTGRWKNIPEHKSFVIKSLKHTWKDEHHCINSILNRVKLPL